MTLTLQNFKQEIDPEILDRGRRYFLNKLVVELEEVADGIWFARVQGTETYKVVIKQGKNEVLTTECTCPYDWGPTCKHIAAVLYKVEETVYEYKESKPHKPRKKRKTREEKVLETLKSITNDELVGLLAELAVQDRQIANMIQARFSDEGDDKKAYIRLVKNALNMGKDQHGFIDYHGSGRAARGVRDVLQRADTDIEQGHAQKAIPVYQAVIETVVPAISYADDSNGELGDCISFALQGLDQAAQTLPPQEQHQLFDYCVSEAQHERYTGWDWGWDLAQIGADLVRTAAQRQKLFDALDKMAVAHQGDGETDQWISEFDYERAETIKFSVIERLDDKETQLAFLHDRVEMVPFREKLVHHHIEQGHLEEARRLCQQLLEDPETPRGYQDIFIDLLLRIAQAEKNQDAIILLAETLFFNTSNFEYYSLLKQTIEIEKWIDFRNKLIVKAKKHFRQDYLVPQIFVREQMWHQLLNYAKQSHRYIIEDYREHLESRFPEEVAAIYEQIVWDLMIEKVNRKGYRQACRYIRRIFRLGQRTQAEALIEDLRSKYSNRPALLDELNRF